MGTHASPPDQGPESTNGETALTKDVELLRVEVVREGNQVNAQWAIHPQLKHELRQEEWKEISDLMTQVTGIVGNRFSKILTDVEPDQPGTA